MTYTNEDLERMKISLGIIDKELHQPLNVKIYRIGKRLRAKGYIAESESRRPETYAIHRADSIEQLARHCIDSFDSKYEVNYINEPYEDIDPYQDAVTPEKFYKLTDNEWVDFNTWMDIIKKS